MSDRKTVLSLYVSKLGNKIEEAKLSASLQAKIQHLDAMLGVVDQLKNEAEELRRRRNAHRVLLITSLTFAGLGLALGLAGFSLGVLDILEVTVSLSAVTGIFIADFYILRIVKKLGEAYHRNYARAEDLTLELDSSLDNTYDEVLSELYRLPTTPSNYARKASRRSPR